MRAVGRTSSSSANVVIQEFSMQKSSTASISCGAGTPTWKQSDRICAARAVGAILSDLLPRLADRIAPTG